MSGELPSPRMPEVGEITGGPDASTWQVLAAIERLRAEITVRFDVLPERFLPRPEADSRFEASARDREALHGNIEEIKDAIDLDRRDRAKDRKWAIGIVVTVLLGLLAMAVTLYVGLHHH